MADPKEIEAILTTQVVTPRSDKAKREFSDFIRRISKRPEIAEKTDDEIADGILLYLQEKEHIRDKQVTTVPTPSDYDKAIKAIQAVKAKEAAQQRAVMMKTESSTRNLFADEEKAAWQAIQDAITQAKEQDKKNQAQRQEVLKQHADASSDLDREHAAMLAEARRAFEAEKENIEKAATLRKQEQARQEELRLRTAQVEARTAQRSLPPEKEQSKLLTEAEKEAQQRRLKDQQEQKKQTQALIDRLVAREAKKGQEAAAAKRAELNEKYKEILSIPDAQVQATADEVQKARELEAAQRIEQERLVAARQQEKTKQQQQHEEALQAKRAALTARKEAKAQQEAATLKAAEAAKKEEQELAKPKEASPDKERRPAPLLIKWHEPGPPDLLRPDPIIARLEAQTAAAALTAAETERTQKAEAEVKQAEERRALGQEKLNEANAKMKEELKASVSSGKIFGMFGGHEEKRNMAISRLTDIYCQELSKHSTALEALSMDKEDKNLIQHNVTQMKPKIEKFCQEHQHEPIEVFSKNMEEWAKKAAEEFAAKSSSVMSLGFRDKYPEPPRVHDDPLDRTFTNTEDASSVRPSESPHKKQDTQQQQRK
jgi:hypothetical protein